MTPKLLGLLPLFGTILLFACVADTAMGWPPQMGNRLLQVQRDQLADALGKSHPSVLSADARLKLEGTAVSRPIYRVVPADTDPKSQLRTVINAFNQLSRENGALRNRIAELERKIEELQARNAEPE